MPIQPFTSRVVSVLEQKLDSASRDLSVTPTIPNKLRNSRDMQPRAIALIPRSVTLTHHVKLRDRSLLQFAMQESPSSVRFWAPQRSRNFR